MNNLFKFFLLLSVTGLVLCAPSAEDMKLQKKDENKEPSPVVDKDTQLDEGVEVKKNKEKESSFMADKDTKLDERVEVKKDEEKESNPMVDKDKQLDERVEVKMDKEIMSAEDSVEKVDMVLEDDIKSDKTIEAQEITKKTDEIVKEVQDSITNSDGRLKLVDSKLRDVASAVAEAVTNLPIPNKPETNKFTQTFQNFLQELMQVPLVILHAISNAVSQLTGINKVTTTTAANTSHP